MCPEMKTAIQKRILSLLCALTLLLPAVAGAEPGASDWRLSEPRAAEACGEVLREELRRVAAYAELGRADFISPKNLRHILNDETGLMFLTGYDMVFATDGTGQVAVMLSHSQGPDRNEETVLNEQHAWIGAGRAMAARLGLKLDPFQTAKQSEPRVYDDTEKDFQLQCFVLLGGDSAWLGDPKAPLQEDLTRFTRWFMAWAFMPRKLLGSQEELPAGGDAPVQIQIGEKVTTLTASSEEGSTTLRFYGMRDAQVLAGFALAMLRLNGLPAAGVEIRIQQEDGSTDTLIPATESDADSAIQCWLDDALALEHRAIGGN